jgi:hypothetical protein
MPGLFSPGLSIQFCCSLFNDCILANAIKVRGLLTVLSKDYQRSI